VKLGCNTVLFAGSGLETALQHIAWAGYDGVELASIPGMVEHLRADADAARLAAIRSLASRYGLALYAIEATGNLLDQAALGRLGGVLECAGDLEIPIVNIGSSGTAEDDRTFQPVLDQLAALAERANTLGVTLGVKAHVGASLWNGQTLLRALQAIPNPAFGVNFDPSHLYRANEDPADTVWRLQGHVVACHMRDNAGRDKKVSPPEQQVPGNGDMDLAAIVAALRDTGYDSYLTFECIGAGAYALSRQAILAAQARGYLHRLLGELHAWG
jgi:sugar phosphate isomerase/epimerase